MRASDLEPDRATAVGPSAGSLQLRNGEEERWNPWSYDRIYLSTSHDCRDVFVLGAGFSRALSDSMPLTDELGNLCLDDQRPHLGARNLPERFAGGTFESWLSHLADEQPYLSAEENLENQALFLRFSSAIARVLGDRVHHVLGSGWPAWFPEFLRVAHQRRPTLVTFNYDPLIECGVGAGLLQDQGRLEPVYWAEVIGDVPNWPPGSARIGAEPAHTFRLLKLHGSLNWYWSPGDATGVSLARRDLPGVYAKPEQYTDEDRQRELPGRVPFVIPPSATKSPYYRNPVIREVWRQAAAALRAADRVVIAGYSLPADDLLQQVPVEPGRQHTKPDVVSQPNTRALLRTGLFPRHHDPEP